RLAHLLAAHGDPAVVQPVPGELVAGRATLRDLVLVMREDQNHSATMNIELRPQIRARHRRALQMPAGPSESPWRGPGRLTGLGALPQREISLITLTGR